MVCSRPRWLGRPKRLHQTRRSTSPKPDTTPPRVENREGMALATRAGLQSPTRLRWVQLRTADNLARAAILASRRFWRRRAFQYVRVAGVCKVEKVVRDVLA